MIIKGTGDWKFAERELPKTDDKVLCWTRTQKGRNNIVVGYYSPELSRWCCGMNSNIIAWSRLPSEDILEDIWQELQK